MWDTLPFMQNLLNMFALSPSHAMLDDRAASAFHTKGGEGREESDAWPKERFLCLNNHDGRGMAICESVPHIFDQNCWCRFFAVFVKKKNGCRYPADEHRPSDVTHAVIHLEESK